MSDAPAASPGPATTLRVALPTSDGVFCAHFGQCDGLWLCELDVAGGKIERPRQVSRKEGGCEQMPLWLGKMGVQLVLAGGIGAGAMERLGQLGIRVAGGYTGPRPEDVVAQFLADPQGSRPNPCGEGHHHHHHHCHGA